MELLYIWIKNYKNLKNVGFNLSGEDYFYYDGIELTSTKKENYINDFFDLKGNINVTAIIGENGTGKTNFFRFILQQLSCPVFFEFEGIIVFNSYGKTQIYHHENIKVLFDNEKITKITNLAKPNKVVNGEKLNESIFVERTKYIYISNILNPDFKNNFDDINFGFFSKIYSKNSLLTKDIDFFNSINKTQNDLRFKDAFAYHNVMELFRQKDLIISDISKDLKGILNFNFPDSLACSVNTFYEECLLSFCKNNKNLVNYERLSNSIKKGVEKLKIKYEVKGFTKNKYGENSINIFKIDIFRAILFLKLFNLFVLYNDIKDKDIKDKFHISERFYNFSYDDITSTITFFKDLFHEISKQNRSPETYINLTEYLFEHINNKKNIFESDGEIYIIFHKNDLNVFFEKTKSVFYRNSFIDLQWFNSESNSFNFLSNGENNILAILSRLYQASVEVNSYDDMYIMIDEGDLGLHPKWQKKFLRICLEVSKRIFKIDRKKFHFIFSSHSPFLLSDLPNYNVILLENNNGKVEIQKNTDLTFAGNIHTLYSKDFFIDEILIGDFAKEKIDSEVVKNLFINPSKDIENKEKEKIKSIINLISEPILRNRFLDKFREVYGD